jgi:hypothetical protein
MHRLGAAIGRLGFTPIDIAQLAVIRILLGTLLFAATVRFAARGWIDELLVGPTVHLPYWFPGAGFVWLEPLSRTAMYGLFGVMAAAAIAIAIGLVYRLAVLVFLVGFVYVELLDATNYLNHYYAITIVLVLLGFAPAHAAWSIDVRRRPELRRDRVEGWVIFALRAQLAIIYAYAGLAKLHADWLDGTVLHMWLRSRADLPLVGTALADPTVAQVMAIAGCAFDLLVVPGLLVRRTRPWAWLALVGFHTATGLLFPIGMFPWIMIALSTAFFDPSWPRRFVRGGTEAAPRSLASTTRRRACVVGLLTAHLAIQILLPLRSLLVPGEVRWHEQGMRWSWRVMLVEKTGFVQLVATEDATGRTWSIDPATELTPRQAKMMATQPDLVVAYAQHVRRTFAARGIDVRVHADAFVALNGRPSRRLIDPTVDLSRVEIDLGAPTFVLPAP